MAAIFVRNLDTPVVANPRSNFSAPKNGQKTQIRPNTGLGNNPEHVF